MDILSPRFLASREKNQFVEMRYFLCSVEWSVELLHGKWFKSIQEVGWISVVQLVLSHQGEKMNHISKIEISLCDGKWMQCLSIEHVIHSWRSNLSLSSVGHVGSQLPSKSPPHPISFSHSLCVYWDSLLDNQLSRQVNAGLASYALFVPSCFCLGLGTLKEGSLQAFSISARIWLWIYEW